MNYPMPYSWPRGRLWQARGGRVGIRGRRAASSRELSKFKLCQNNFHPSIKKNKSSRGRIWSHGGSVAAPQWGSGAGESKPGFPRAAAPRGSKNRRPSPKSGKSCAGGLFSWGGLRAGLAQV